MQLNRQQQQEYSERINKELDRMTMSWDNVLRDWHPIAIKALDFANVRVMQVPQNKFVELFKTEVHGLNMNIVMALCNNMEDRSAHEMGVSARAWAEILLKNNEVARRWNELVIPVQQKVNKEFEILYGKNQGLKIIKAEA